MNAGVNLAWRACALLRGARPAPQLADVQHLACGLLMQVGGTLAALRLSSRALTSRDSPMTHLAWVEWARAPRLSEPTLRPHASNPHASGVARPSRDPRRQPSVRRWMTFAVCRSRSA